MSTPTITAYAMNIHHALNAPIASDENGSPANIFATSIMYERSTYAGKATIGASGPRAIPPKAAIAEKNIAAGTATSASRFAGIENIGSCPF